MTYPITNIDHNSSNTEKFTPKREKQFSLKGRTIKLLDNVKKGLGKMKKALTSDTACTVYFMALAVLITSAGVGCIIAAPFTHGLTLIPLMLVGTLSPTAYAIHSYLLNRNPFQ